MLAVQRWCAGELERRGLPGALAEQPVEGAYRTKKWDVVLADDDQVRLAISTKSIMKNIAGTVPNRLDDMLGEAVDLHRAHPRAVIGYFALIAERDMRPTGRDAATWFERCGNRLEKTAGRLTPSEPAECWEAGALLRVGVHEPPVKSGSWHPALLDADQFFDQLVELVHIRSWPGGRGHCSRAARS